MSSKKNSAPNLTFKQILQDDASDDEDDSFNIPKEAEIYLGEGMRSSTLTSSSNDMTTSSSTLSPQPKRIQRVKRYQSQPQVSSLPKKKKKKVSFKDIEIVQIESLKRFNNNISSDKEKSNNCSCLVF